MKRNIILPLLTLLAISCSKEESVPERRIYGNCGRESKTIFVATDRHDVGNGNNLKALVQLTSQNMGKKAPDFYLIGGDNVGQGPMSDSLANPPYHISDIYSEILAGDGRKEVNFLTTYGSHDLGCLDSYYDFFSGPRACDGYYLYGISYAQMVFAADSSAAAYTGLDKVDSFGISAESASQAFLRWTASLRDTAPIIIMSHVPIHASRGDNPGAAIWASALNKAASRHAIFLLYGHNHTNEETGGIMPTPMQGEAIKTVNEQDYYMVLPGDKLPVQTADRAVTDTVTVRFVYMNAGYIKLGYASTIKLIDSNKDGNFETYGIERHTILDTSITKFGNTNIPNPVYLR